MFELAYPADDSPVSVNMPGVKGNCSRHLLQQKCKVVEAKGKRTHKRALRPQWTESPEPCARQEEVEHNRAKTHDSTESTEACAETKELVPER